MEPGSQLTEPNHAKSDSSVTILRTTALFISNISSYGCRLGGNELLFLTNAVYGWEPLILLDSLIFQFDYVVRNVYMKL